MSGFEIITITFSFIVGLGVAQMLRAVSDVIRDRDHLDLHWLPFLTAGMILFFQIQFWFGLAVINSILDEWAWPVYSLVLFLAVTIFLGGATVLPSRRILDELSLLEDYEAKGKISLVFLALYLLGWIGVCIMFWRPEFWLLVVINGAISVVCIITYGTRRFQPLLHGVLLALTVWGSLTVWTTPNLQMPMQPAAASNGCSESESAQESVRELPQISVCEGHPGDDRDLITVWRVS